MKTRDIDYLKSYWGYLRRYRAILGFGFVLIPLISAFQLIQPMLLKRGIDTDIAAGDLEGLWFTASLFGACVLGELICRTAQAYLFQHIGIRSVTDIRDDLFRHILNLSSSYFDKTPIGKLVTRVTSDIEALNETFSSGVVTLLADLVTLIGIIGFMFYLSPQLTLITLLAVPPLILIVNFFRVRLRHWYNKVRTAVSNLHSYLQEQIEGYSIVQLFLREQRNFEGYREENKLFRTANLHSVVYDAFLYAVIDSFSSIVIALMIWYGFQQHVEGVLTLGLLVAFIEYIRKFFIPLKELSSKFAILQAALAALEKIFDSFAIDEIIPSGNRRPSEDGSSLRFDKVSFSYPGHEDKPVLKDISFEVNPGEVVAIVGPTGSGKSTVSRLVSHLYTGYQGRIEYNGVNLNELDIQQLRSKIAVVLQDVTLFSRSIAFNLTLGDSSITESSYRKAAQLVQADSFIEAFPDKYQHLLQGRGSGLSAGQGQLLSFARALAASCPIVILDEATSAVDSMSEKLIQDAIATIFEAKTVLVIAHRLSTIKKASRILAMKNGRVVEQGTHEELLAKGGFYAKLFQMQFAHM